MCRVLLLLSTLLPALIVAVPARAQETPEPLFNVEPKEGRAGTRFRFMATGFLAYEDVGIWLNDPDGQPVEAHYDGLNPATDFGRVDWNWTAPANIRSGAWQMIARGKKSGVQRIIPIQIVAADIPVPAPGQPPSAPGVDFNVEPKAGHPGTRFAFVAFGFRDNERVDVWINTPQGQPLPAAVENLGRATSRGRVDWYWRAPSYLRPGIWQTVARGSESRVERVIPVEIR